jgi:hypothetical protein
MLGDEFVVVLAFIYLWPVTIIALVALCVCGVCTEAEYEEGMLTSGGKLMVRSRIALVVCCGIYCLCLCLLVPFASENSPVIKFLFIHWPALLIAIAGANVLSLLAAVYGFQARGSGLRIIRIATAVAAIASTALTVLLGFALSKAT